MLSVFKNMFSSGDLAQLLSKGAIVIDVRTKEEFASGHVKGSVNIPLDQIASKTEELKKHAAIIVCCRSGNRSAQAQSILNSKGIKQVTNGGTWQNVNDHLKKNS